jgi:hypothetical protein
MKLEEFSKDVRRLLLEHWTKQEIEDRLQDPDYFIDHVVQPRLTYLRKQGEDIPTLRMDRSPDGRLRVYLAH